MAMLHRAWMNVRSALSTNDTKAIIAEVMRGEEVAIRNYESVLNGAIREEVKLMLADQLSEIKTSYRSLEILYNRAQLADKVGEITLAALFSSSAERAQAIELMEARNLHIDYTVIRDDSATLVTPIAGMPHVAGMPYTVSDSKSELARYGFERDLITYYSQAMQSGSTVLVVETTEAEKATVSYLLEEAGGSVVVAK